MTQLTYGSLFSGIGGIDLGLDRAGMHCKWQVEIDAYCQKVLAKHWPNVARYGDIRECGAHNLEPVDLICGGFPCQDISNAGKRAGIEGERSGLWKEFYRVICELQPQYVLVENVSALLHRGIERVLGDLAESGYDAEWQVLSAAAFGAPHKRDRVFIVAYPQSLYVQKSKVVISQEKSPFQSGRIPPHDLSRNQWKTCQPSFLGMDGGVSYWVDRVRGLGNAVVPQVAEYIGRCILAAIEAEEVAVS